MQEFLDKISQYLKTPHLIVIAANCEINYSGRVESYLPLGDRLIIIKADRTLLIHQPSGVNPINYMKEGTEHVIEKTDDGTFLKSRNIFLKDFMTIKFDKIHSVTSHPLEDGHKIQLQGSEADMRDMIYANPSLIEEGFKPYSREEHTQFGFIDVFGTDKKGKVVVIECKREIADFKAVHQLHRYIHRIMKSKGVREKDMRGIIASPKISENAQAMLKEHGYEHKSIVPPKYLQKYDKKQSRLLQF